MLDYCPRNMIQVEEHVRTEKYLGKPGSELGKNLILLTMLQNHENKTVEMVMLNISICLGHKSHAFVILTRSCPALRSLTGLDGSRL